MYFRSLTTVSVVTVLPSPIPKNNANAGSCRTGFADSRQDVDWFLYSMTTRSPVRDTMWVEKTTKTTSSTREIVIPMEIADKVREKGYIYKGHPNSITRFLENTEDALGIPRFPLHKLRHYFASKMSALNIPEADRQQAAILTNLVIFSQPSFSPFK